MAMNNALWRFQWYASWRDQVGFTWMELDRLCKRQNQSAVSVGLNAIGFVPFGFTLIYLDPVRNQGVATPVSLRFFSSSESR